MCVVSTSFRFGSCRYVLHIVPLITVVVVVVVVLFCFFFFFFFFFFFEVGYLQRQALSWDKDSCYTRLSSFVKLFISYNPNKKSIRVTSSECLFFFFFFFFFFNRPLRVL